MFTSSGATASAKKFRRRGLTGTALDIATALPELGLSKGSILEVGGGVGQIQIALLEAGSATAAFNVELSSNWETEAHRLLEESGLEDKVQRKVGDFVAEASTVAATDAVILHRVVCCYPDWQAMLTAATSKAHRLLAMTFPKDSWWVRAMIGIGNRFLQLRGEPFRGYVHPVKRMIGLLETQGFEIASYQSGLAWETLIARRKEAST